MKPRLKDSSSTLLIGEPYWIQSPPEEAYESYGTEFTSLEGTLDRFGELGFEVIEMLMSDHDEWDRYEASQWKTVYNWLRQNPDDIDAVELKKWISNNRRMYFRFGANHFFVGAGLAPPRFGNSLASAAPGAYNAVTMMMRMAHHTARFVWLTAGAGSDIGEPPASQ